MTDLKIVLILLAIGVVVFIVAFIIFRSIVLWYFQINERLRLQKEIVNELIKFNNK